MNNSEKVKVCQQCHRTLEEDQFRPTPSRGTGLRQRKTGSRNICRSCESKNTLAYRYAKRLAEGLPVDEAALLDLKAFYGNLLMAGYPLPSMGRRLLGIGEAPAGQTAPPPERENLAELYGHIYKLRRRSYSSVDEADEVHRQLAGRLRDAKLYEEANNLLDDWFLEG